MPRRLLIVDDVATNRIVLTAKLAAAGYAVDMATDVARATAAISKRLPDVALISTALSDPDAGHLPRLLGARGQRGRIPVILLDGTGNPPIPCAEVDTVIHLPATDGLMLARIRSVLRVRDLEEELAMRTSTCRDLGLAEEPAPFAAQRNLLVVGHDPAADATLAGSFGRSLNAEVAALPLDGLFGRLDRQGEIDVVLIDANPVSPALDLHLLSDLRCRPETRLSALILRLPGTAQTEAGMALDLGAADVILGDPGPGHLEASIAIHLERQARIRRLRDQVTDGLRLAVTDQLTGLYNRRYALSHLGRLITRSSATGRALAVMLLDIDRFKQVNDTHGHQNGDRVIQAVARTLKDNLRTADLVARYGGEEFLVTMPETTVQEANSVAQRLRRRIAGLGVALDNACLASVTISIGLAVQVATDGATATAAEDLIRSADQALYRSKAEGRNQVTLHKTAA